MSSSAYSTVCVYRQPTICDRNEDGLRNRPTHKKQHPKDEEKVRERTKKTDGGSGQTNRQQFEVGDEYFCLCAVTYKTPVTRQSRLY